MSTPPPKMSRAMGRANGANDTGELGVVLASELAEALFLTVQALKSTGRDCAEEASPEVRAMSPARGRVLAAVADAEDAAKTETIEPDAATISTQGGIRRGRHRFHEALAAHAERGRVRMGDLAAALGVTARNVTTIVDGLEGEGLLTRQPHPTDRRVILLELTEKGRAHIAQIHALHRSTAERFFAPLDPAERRDLLRLLAKIRGGADGATGHGDTP